MKDRATTANIGVIFIFKTANKSITKADPIL